MNRGMIVAALAVLSGGAAPIALTSSQEVAFVQIVDQEASAYEAAPNDMAKGQLRPQRGRRLCSEIPIKAAEGRVRDWIGTVETLSSTNDGHGVLSVRVAKRVLLATHAIAWGDESYKTLLEPGSAIFQAAVLLKVGKKVRFSGTFFPSQVDCDVELSLTQAGTMLDPSFLFRFTAISPTE